MIIFICELVGNFLMINFSVSKSCNKKYSERSYNPDTKQIQSVFSNDITFWLVFSAGVKISECKKEIFYKIQFWNMGTLSEVCGVSLGFMHFLMFHCMKF